LNARLRNASPQEVLRVALATFPDRIALVSSFGSESAVLLHMLSEIDRDAPVLFLDTGQLFGQTLDYRRSLTAQLGLTGLHDLRPHPLVEFGYPSVGCWPCTKPVESAQASDIRAGRWADSDKTECGIHTPRASVLDGDADVGGDI